MTDGSTEPPLSESSDSLPASRDLPTLLKIIGSVVAPTTLLTALMLYFGRLHAYWFFQYFRVNFTALDLTPQDFLIRSADGLFVPLTMLAAVVLVSVWGYRLMGGRLPASTWRAIRRRLPIVSVAAGTVLVSVALAAVIEPVRFENLLALPGLSLATGVLLLAGASRMGTSRQPPGPVVLAEWAAVFVLVSVGLFWSVGDYAGAVGTARGYQVEASLPALPDAVVYTAESLNLHVAGVSQTPCQNPAASYRFRYDGLKLVLQSGNQYLLLPATWTPVEGTAVLIPRSDALRLEFLPAGMGTAGPHSGC
jgi:hypothetical protein